jgi:group I intron endonuclease
MKKIFKIYKIQFPNGKVYIGQSVNHKNRWREHLREAAKGNDLKIYRAMRKYNITIEAFSIIEDGITSQDEANSKETYYIKKFNSIKNGYNIAKGGQCGNGLYGESHPNHILTDNQIKEIREIRASKIYTVKEVYAFYDDLMSYSGFQKIWLYESRPEIASELNTQELRDFYSSDKRSIKGEKHFLSKLTTEEVIKVRNQYWVEGLEMKEIYKNFKDKYSLSGFRKIVLGNTYTDIPMPEKSNKCKKRKDKLTKEQVLFIREKYDSGVKIMEIIKNWFPDYKEPSIYLIATRQRYKNW